MDAMRLAGRIATDLSSARTQHLVFLAHVWACAPFMLPWLRDPAVHAKLGDAAIAQLRPMVGLIVAYLVGRTILAWRNPAWLRWAYVFPPLDVILVSAILFVSHRGPLSNLTMLYFLPIVQASASLNVRWAAGVGLMVVVGTALATLSTPGIPADPRYLMDPALMGTRELFAEDPLNVAFRIWFLIVISSLMTFQARIAADYRAEARVAAERARLALDMHDGVQGGLISLATQLQLIERLAERDGARTAQVAGEAREVARQTADELRFLVQRMRGPELAAGFVPALRQYAHNVCERTGLRLEFDLVGEERPFAPETEQALFRIAQEALTNVAKHAQARSVTVRVVFDSKAATLSVRDDGVGIAAGTSEGVGLTGMRERAGRVGGKFRLDGTAGTLVEVRVPARASRRRSETIPTHPQAVEA